MAKVKSDKKTEEQKNGETEDLQNRLVRALADYQNLVKRLEKEREEIIFRANRNLIADLLPVADNLERAQKHLHDHGLQMALDQFLKILPDYGVEQIRVEIGDKFDSNLHEAIDSTEGGEEETVAQVLAKGYKWKDGKVIRPAKVQVYGGEKS